MWGIVLLFVLILAIAIFWHREKIITLIKPVLQLLTPGGPRVEPFFVNIEKTTNENNAWRRVLHTAGNIQTVVMATPPGQELGWEVHADSDQLFRVESGVGQLRTNDVNIKSGHVNYRVWNLDTSSLAVVPRGVWHNVVNTGNEPLKFYTVYGPPHHPSGTVDMTHTDEIARESKM